MSNLLLIGKGHRIVVPPPEPPSGPPGTPYGGGFYAGNIVVDGQEYYLVVATQAATVSRAWKTAASNDAFAFTVNDGWTNSNFINDAAHPAAQYARAYTGGGFTDWYLGSRDEMEICYRVFKPSTQANIVGTRQPQAGGGAQGSNTNSNPTHPAYTSGSPARTTLTNFQAAQPEAFVISPAYWTSTQATLPPTYDGHAMVQSFFDGDQFTVDKTNNTGQVRPVRRIPKIVPPLPEIGEAYEGGFFAGQMNIDGATYNIVVGPKSTEMQMAFKTTATADAVNSLYDGWTNCLTLNNAAHPAIQYCRGLTTGGFNDWFLASRDEWEVVYRNLKLNNTANGVFTRVAGAGGGANGLNTNSIPPGAAYTTTDPAQTSAAAFATGGAQALTGLGDGYVTSTCDQGGTIVVIQQNSANGNQSGANKNYFAFWTRPIRRVLVS